MGPFTRNAPETLYEQMIAPVLVLYAAAYSSFDELAPFTSKRESRVAARIAKTRGLPHLDEPEQTVCVIRDFWAGDVSGVRTLNRSGLLRPTQRADRVDLLGFGDPEIEAGDDGGQGDIDDRDVHDVSATPGSSTPSAHY